MNDTRKAFLTGWAIGTICTAFGVVCGALAAKAGW